MGAGGLPRRLRLLAMSHNWPSPSGWDVGPDPWTLIPDPFALLPFTFYLYIPRLRPMISFMISVEPAKIVVTRTSRKTLEIGYSFM